MTCFPPIETVWGIYEWCNNISNDPGSHTQQNFQNPKSIWFYLLSMIDENKSVMLQAGRHVHFLSTFTDLNRFQVKQQRIYLHQKVIQLYAQSLWVTNSDFYITMNHTSTAVIFSFTVPYPNFCWFLLSSNFSHTHPKKSWHKNFELSQKILGLNSAKKSVTCNIRCRQVDQ